MKKLNIVLFILFLLWGCSTKKNTFLSRKYHNLTSRYNVFFNARLNFNDGLKKIEKSYKYDYTELLPIFIYSDDKISKSIAPEMNKTIEKSSKLIKIHSITEKPKKKKNKKLSEKDKKFYALNEYTKWVDDAYLLMGEAHFYKHDFFPAKENFEYVIKEYSDNEIKYEAMIWLSRLYIELENYIDAKKILDQLDGDKNFPEKYKHDYDLTIADFYLQKEKYEDVIPMLRYAASTETKKRNKARFYYLMAQLSEQIGNIEDASFNFGEVIKMNPDYEMAFNARINRARLYNKDISGSKDIKKELEKMLKDDKNIEYKDQIYYALAKISERENEPELALENYLLSIQSSVSNNKQKALSYLAIADNYFDKPDYKLAQAYYDSTVSLLDIDFPNYNIIFNKSKSLNELVENLNIVEREDSLQKIASMSESDRNAFILALIEEVKEEEEKLKEAEKQNALLPGSQVNRQLGGNVGGKWYFYNPVALGMGQSEFTKIWGRRKLEDNWRRKNKAISNTAIGEIAENSADSSKNLFNNKQPEYYLQNLPLTDSTLRVSDALIAEALFNMARVYKEKLKDYPRSIEIFKDLNSRFPENENALSAYYFLYLLNKELKKEEAAEYYKRLIATDYPDSQYASILTNPNYFKELEEKQNKIRDFYKTTFNYYQNNNFDSVIINYNYASANYSDSELLPKFLYLKTLVTGKTQSVENFESELEELVKAYPESDVSIEAENIIAYINRDEEPVIEEPKTYFEEDEEALGGETDTLSTEIYDFNKRSTHFYMILVENIKTDVNQIKFGIANFNIDYFSTLEFNISSALLNDKFQFVTVKSFKNKNQAMNYYESITEFGEFFKSLDENSYRHFVISNENYVKFYKDKNIGRYYKFFKENYLNEK